MFTFLYNKFTQDNIFTKLYHNRLGFVDFIAKKLWCVFFSSQCTLCPKRQLGWLTGKLLHSPTLPSPVTVKHQLDYFSHLLSHIQSTFPATHAYACYFEGDKQNLHSELLSPHSKCAWDAK